MVRWCLDNREKWDDVASYTAVKTNINTKNVRKKTEETDA
jgi:hypothetical protein